MSNVDVAWAIGRKTIHPLFAALTRVKVYGKENVPMEGGCVLACNHFSWVDPPVFGIASPRNVYFMAKVEAHRVPGLGALIRAFGTISVRRGESDRDAVRLMRQTVADGNALGLFVEGTRQTSGVPGTVQPGAAMVAIQEDVPIVPAAVYGSNDWRLGNFKRVTFEWGKPMRFDGLQKGGKGYKEASLLLEEEIRRLWEGLGERARAGG